MIRDILTLPRTLTRQLNFDWDIDWRGQGTGERNDGSSQFVVNEFPRWVGAPKLVLSDAEILEWRAIRARMRGALGLIRVEMIDPLTAPELLHAMGEPFGDGSLFADGGEFAEKPVVICPDGASAGAQVITIEAGAAPRVGQLLSHDDWPFIVVKVTPDGAGRWVLDIEMALRREIPEGGLIDLRPRGIFERTDPQGGNPDFGLEFEARPELGLQEFLNRA